MTGALPWDGSGAHHREVVEHGGSFARRVLLADARGGDRFLRVTWHPDGGQFVISHWQHDVCEAATRVRIDDIVVRPGVVRWSG